MGSFTPLLFFYRLFLQYQQDARKLSATIRGALELPGNEQPGPSPKRILESRTFLNRNPLKYSNIHLVENPSAH